MCLKDNQLHRVNLAAPLQIGNVSVRNRVALAPMSGVTDMPFRQLAWRYGAGLVVTEMVASRELVNNTAESWSASASSAVTASAASNSSILAIAAPPIRCTGVTTCLI